MTGLRASQCIRVHLCPLAMVIVGFYVLFGCGTEASIPPSLEVGSIETIASAGVEIGEYSRDADVHTERSETSSTRLRVVEPHLLEIGEVSGEAPYLLNGVTSALRLSNGTFVIANGGTRELRFFDSSGRYLHTRGRAGGGPGEYETLRGVWRIHGDSLLSYDGQLRRITILDPAGEYVRDRRVEFGAISPIGALLDGTLVGHVPGVREVRPEGFTREGIEIALLSETTTEPIRLEGEFFSGEILPMVSDVDLPGLGTTRMYWQRSVPFARSTFVAVGDDRVYIGTSDSYEIRVHRSDGGFQRVVRRANVPQIPVGDALINEEVEATIAGRPGTSRLADVTDPIAIRENILSLPRVPTLPVFSGLIVTDTGDLWVREYLPTWVSEGSVEWTIFDREGRMKGSVLVPRGVRVLQVGSDFILGLIEDDLEVEKVRLYGIASL